MAKKKQLKPGSRDGRPSVLTPEIQKQIVGYIEAGCYVETAAQAAGIHKATFYQWLKKSHDDKKDNIYSDFRDAIEKAMAVSELRDVENIQQAAASNWQASAWRLERKFPNRWGRKDRTETTVTVKPYVIEDPSGKAVIKLGSEELDTAEISQQAIAASEETYYSIETIEDEDNLNVSSENQSDID